MRIYKFLILAMALLIVTACQQNGNDTSSSETNNDSPEVESDEKITFRYGHYFPDDDIHGQEANYFADLIYEKSNGTMEVEVYPNEELVTGEDGFQATSSGTVDFYPTLTAYISGQIPLLKIYSMPFPHSSFEDESLVAFTEEANPIYEEYFEQNNVKNLGMISTLGSTSLYLTEPAFSLEKLEGMNIRTGGGLFEEALELINANPVFMSAGELYTALQTGVVDGIVTAYTSYDSMNLHEVAPYWLRTDTERAPYLLSMNLERWNDLTEEQQKIIEEAVVETRDWVLQEFEKIEGEMAERAKENVEGYHEVTEEEWQEINKLMEPLHEKYLEENGEKGEEMLELYQKYQTSN